MRNKTSGFTVGGIEIELQRKNIKNLHLYVLPPDGRVRISAPMRLSKEQIAGFVSSKLDWIRKQQAKLAEKPPVSVLTYQSGETFYLSGKPYTLYVEYGNGKKSVRLEDDRIILNIRAESTAEQREKVVNEWYRVLLKEQIALLLPKWERITGLYSASWQIKNMKTRWGTCNTQTKKIWLNLRLAEKPSESLEYVILHELVHLKIPGHGKDFEAVLDRYMPDWRERRERLNISL